MRIILSSFLSLLCDAADGQSSDVAQDIIDTLIAQTKSTPEENAERKDAGIQENATEIPADIVQPAGVLQKRLTTQTQETSAPQDPVEEEQNAMMDKAEKDENFAHALKQFADLEKDEIARGEQKNANAELSGDRDDDGQDLFGGFAPDDEFGDEGDIDEDGMREKKSGKAEMSDGRDEANEEDENPFVMDMDKSVDMIGAPKKEDNTMPRRAPPAGVTQGTDTYAMEDEDEDDEVREAVTESTTWKPVIAEAHVEADITATAMRNETHDTSNVNRPRVTVRKEFNSILHGPDPPHEKIEQLLRWLDRQDKEAVDSLWPDIEHALEESMKKNNDDEWGKLGVWAADEKEEDEIVAEEDRAEGEEFYDLGNLHKNHAWTLAGCLSGLGVSLGIYAFYATRNRRRERSSAPLMGSMDGYSNSLESA